MVHSKLLMISEIVFKMTALKVKIVSSIVDWNNNVRCGTAIGDSGRLYSMFVTGEQAKDIVQKNGYYLLKNVDVGEIQDAVSEPKWKCRLTSKSKVGIQVLVVFLVWIIVHYLYHCIIICNVLI